MACNGHASAATLEVATKFCDFQATSSGDTVPGARAGEATSHLAPVGKNVYYCRFIVNQDWEWRPCAGHHLERTGAIRRSRSPLRSARSNTR
jgi:hypothetical protein